jgi:hypothetical protein
VESDTGVQSPYIEELEEDVLPGLSPGSNNWSPPRSESPEPLAQVQEGPGQERGLSARVDQVKVIIGQEPVVANEETSVEPPRKKNRPGSLQRKRKFLNRIKLVQQVQPEHNQGSRTIVESGETTLVTRTFPSEQVQLERLPEGFYLPYLPPTSPAWEVREALLGRLGIESLHFVALLVKDRIGSSLRFRKKANLLQIK